MSCPASSGGRTRTSGLRVMSPTSYQLLYPAILDCKGKNIFLKYKMFFAFSLFQLFLPVPCWCRLDGVFIFLPCARMK